MCSSQQPISAQDNNIKIVNYSTIMGSGSSKTSKAENLLFLILGQTMQHPGKARLTWHHIQSKDRAVLQFPIVPQVVPQGQQSVFP
jgi:hypothetical protein